MLKYFFGGIFLFLITNAVYGQDINVSDMIKMVNLSHQKAAEFIVKERKFDTLRSIIVLHRTISQYSRNTSKSTQFVVKNEWEDNHRIIRSVHYEFKPQSYAIEIIRQFEQLGFKLKSKEDDSQKHVRIYESDRYIANIYTYEDKKNAASTEIHEK